MGYPNAIQEINTIKSNYLPKSGGIMSGVIRTSSHITKSVDNSYLDIYGGTSHQRGSQLTLFGCEYINNPGLAQITSYDGNGNYCFFRVFPNGKVDTNGNLYHSDTSSRVFFCGGTTTENGSHLEVTGKDCVADFGGGAFSLRAKDGTNTSCLDGYPNGGLYWQGKLVEGIDSSHKGTVSGDYSWIRYTNGLQFIWGRHNHAGTNTQINFPVAFVNNQYAIQLCTDWSGDTISAVNTVCWVGSINTTYFKIYRNYESDLYWNFTATGYWK